MPTRLEDEKYWRKRAERMRALAAEMPAPQQSILMTDLAEQYERLAAEAALTDRLGRLIEKQRQSRILHATRI